MLDDSVVVARNGYDEVVRLLLGMSNVDAYLRATRRLNRGC